MTEQITAEIMQAAQRKCDSAGVKLTEKRKRVLSVLIENGKAMSAYEIASRVSELFTTSVPPMSVYRMLDVLVSKDLVHKLHSENKFIACAEVGCDHQAQMPQFLICEQCQKVTEVTFPNEILSALDKSVGQAGFKLLNSQLELSCLCGDCATTH